MGLTKTDVDGLVKDETGAIINTNLQELNAYRAKARAVKVEKMHTETIAKIQKDVAELQSIVAEVREEIRKLKNV